MSPPSPLLSTAARRRGVAIALLAASLALDTLTIRALVNIARVNPPPAFTLLTDPAEVRAHQPEPLGTFATGGEPGDRVIVVTADGRVTFSEIAATKPVPEGSDTYRLGRRGKKLCLATATSGIIDLENIDTLAYSGDTYRRKEK